MQLDRKEWTDKFGNDDAYDQYDLNGDGVIDADEYAMMKHTEKTLHTLDAVLSYWRMSVRSEVLCCRTGMARSPEKNGSRATAALLGTTPTIWMEMGSSMQANSVK